MSKTANAFCTHVSVCHLDDGCQGILRVLVVLRWVVGVLLDVQPDGGAGRPGAGEAEDDAGSVCVEEATHTHQSLTHS